MNRLSSWMFRDLETMIAWLMNAAENIAEIENNDNISGQVRELASEARTNVKGALMLGRELRAQQESMLSGEESKVEG